MRVFVAGWHVGRMGGASIMEIISRPARQEKEAVATSVSTEDTLRLAQQQPRITNLKIQQHSHCEYVFFFKKSR